MTAIHPQPAEIAALDEEILAPDDRVRVEEHLSRCPDCTQVRLDLRALRDGLASLPDPGPMPEGVAARIDAALAAEAARPAPPVSRETQPLVAGPVAPEPGSRPRWPRLALAAAGALCALGLGATLTQQLGTDSGRHAESGASLLDSGDEAAEDASGSAPRSATPEAGTANDPLEHQVRELLADAESDSAPLATPEGSGSQGSEQDREEAEHGEAGEESAPELPVCVASAIDRAEPPMAAEREEFQGIDSYLVILPHRLDPDRVDAYVVDADCVDAGAAATGDIVTRQSYPLDE